MKPSKAQTNDSSNSKSSDTKSSNDQPKELPTKSINDPINEPIDEADEYDHSKNRGLENHEKRKVGTQGRQYCRSSHVKQNKIREVRRNADRHGHHRRRNVVRNEFAKGNVEGVEDLPISSSCNQHGQFGLWGSRERAQAFSNRKKML